MRKKLSYIIKLALTCTVVLGVVLGSLGLSAQNVSAATSAEDLLKKTLLNGLRTCTSSTYMKNEITPADYTGIGSIMTSEGNADGTILVPTKVGNSLSDGDVSCKELFLGYSGFLGAGGEISGLLDLYGKSDDDITNFGYTIGESSAGGSRQGCVSYNYSYPDNGRQSTATTNEVCFEVDADNKVIIQDGSDVKWSEASSPVGLSYDSYNGCLLLSMDGTSAATQIVSGIQYGTNMSWDELVSKFENDGGAISTATDTLSHNLGYEFEGANTDLDGGESYSTATKQGNSRLDIMHYLTGDSSFDDQDAKFTENDKYSLYTEYFNAAKNDYDTLTVASECSASKDTASGETGYAIRLGDEWCAVYGVDDVDASYNIVNDTNDGLRNVSFAEMLKAMMDLNYDEIDDVNEETDVGLSGTDTSGSGEEEADPCYSNSGALGWILCPIVSGASDALTGVYKTVVEGFLQINPELINSNSPDSGAYGAWNIFRNLANVVLIIIMLLVVLSQLTGYGISNYGIKKMLPRLVVLAILINLSYVVCQLLVDVSNILGSSLNSFLTNIASSLHSSGSSSGGGALDILTTILGVGGAALIAAGAVYIGGWTLIIPIVLIVVAGLLAVLFMYLLLGIRQALVVLMVAMAPVIIVLYVLPNTQNIAKRGLNLFMGLLMVYPLAGLLMGGCHLASAILLSTTSGTVTDAYTWMIQLIGIALLVIPFFLLPWLVKSTFAAADSVLGKLTNQGQALKGNLQGRARGGLEKGGLGQRAEQQRQQRAQSRTLRMRSGANKRLSKAREKYDAAQAAYGANPNAFTRRRADRASAALVAAGGQADAAEKQLNDAANAAVMQAYGDSSNDQIVEVMRGSLDSGYANTDMGGRQFAAMATMLAGRGGKGVEALENLMGKTAFGEENAKNNKAWHQAMTPEVVKQMKDKSVLGGAMTSQIAKTAAPVRNEQPKAIQGLSAQDQLQEIRDASVSTLAAQSNQAFANTVDRFSDKQIKDLHADNRSMSQLSAQNRDMVNARYAKIMSQEGSTDAAGVAGSAGASAGSSDSNTAASSATSRADTASASINLDDVPRETLIVPHGVQGENVAHASQADMEAMARKLRDDQDRRRGRRR